MTLSCNVFPQIYEGYVDDPRNTDNAWLETTVYHYHDDDGNILKHFNLRVLNFCVWVQKFDNSWRNRNQTAFSSNFKFLCFCLQNVSWDYESVHYHKQLILWNLNCVYFDTQFCPDECFGLHVSGRWYGETGVLAPSVRQTKSTRISSLLRATCCWKTRGILLEKSQLWQRAKRYH